jgi:hypothetical protein
MLLLLDFFWLEEFPPAAPPSPLPLLPPLPGEATSTHAPPPPPLLLLLFPLKLNRLLLLLLRFVGVWRLSLSRLAMALWPRALASLSTLASAADRSGPLGGKWLLPDPPCSAAA